MDKINIAVVGATGWSVRPFWICSAKSDLPIGQIHALASSRSVGKRITSGRRSVAVADVSAFEFADVDYALVAVPLSVAEAVIPRVVARRLHRARCQRGVERRAGADTDRPPT